RGNHDSEWRWPAVQEELRCILAELSGCPRRKIDRLVEFHDWFYLEPGFFYAEHGHAHDHYSVQADFFSAHNDDTEIELPLSSKVLRYFVNRYAEQVELADDVDAWGLKEYLDWVLKAGNPLRVAADYFVMVFRVIYPMVRQSLRISRAFARAALNARLGKQRRTNAHPMLQAAARRVAKVFDVKYIVMGHSHRMVEEAVGNTTRYFNLGSWTGRSNDGFPHVVVTGGLAELRRW